MWEIDNNAQSLEKALNLDAGSAKHEYNFMFLATLNGHKVRVYTHPSNVAQSKVKIMSILIIG